MEDREEEHDLLAEPMHLRGAVHAADAVLAAGKQLRGKFPSVHTTRGWISSICFIRWPLQASISSGWGSRLPEACCAGTLATKHCSRVRPISPSRVSSSFGAAHERLALLILVEAGRLADEHQVRIRVSVPEDDLRPRTRERTLLAVRKLAPQADQLFSPGGSLVHCARMLGAPTDEIDTHGRRAHEVPAIRQVIFWAR